MQFHFADCLFFTFTALRNLFFVCLNVALSSGISTSKCKKCRDIIFWYTIHICRPEVFLASCSRRSVVASYWFQSLWPTLAGGILGRSLGATQRGSFWTCRPDEEPSWWGRARPPKVKKKKKICITSKALVSFYNGVLNLCVKGQKTLNVSTLTSTIMQPNTVDLRVLSMTLPPTV